MKFIKLLILPLILCSCLGDGTDTGNPGFNGDPMMGIEEGSGPIATIVSNVCTLLEGCEGTSLTNCSSDIFDQENIDTELGLGTNDFPTLRDIALAESNGTIVADTTALTDCNSDIQALTCGSPNVGGAYDSALANPYVGVADIIPGSCVGIYGP